MKRYPVSMPQLGEGERAAVLEVVNSGWLTYGPKVKEFERALAEYLRVHHVFCCSNGTAALHLALLACDVKEGDEVLVPDITYVATANAVKYCGAKPVLVDVDRHTWQIDLLDAQKQVTEKTKAIIPVHLYGVPCNFTEVDDFASKNKLIVIEDAAEALGAKWGSRPAGTAGLCGTFSFYGNKLITTGEGGAVCTNDNVIAKRIYSFRGQCQDADNRYFHNDVGYNYRMTDLQGAIGLAQLDNIEMFLEKRRAVLAAYYLGLTPYMETQLIPEPAYTSAWLFTALCKTALQRTGIASYLNLIGIETRPMFKPLSTMPMYKMHGMEVSADISGRGISLPTYPGLEAEDVQHIVERVKEALHV